MIRDIKFRAWDKDRKVMANISNIDFLTGQVQMNAGGMHSERVSGDKVILLQYTGLKDKNSVEIYEGDIINYERRGKEQVGIVEYYASACSFLLSDTHLLLSAGAFVPYFVGEVIGNIYENPELLEREAE